MSASVIMPPGSASPAPPEPVSGLFVPRASCGMRPVLSEYLSYLRPAVACQRPRESR
jgi:hypothetical protein